MKKWLTLSLALVAAAVSQAVTVAWTVPNTNSTSTGEGAWWTQVGSAYFVYSESQLSAEENYKAVYDQAISSGTSAFSWGETYPNNGKQTLLGLNVAGPDWPSPSEEQPNPSASGYYYMVVVNNQNEYAVAGTQVDFTYTAEGENSGWTAEKGVYLNEVGSAPTAYEYFDDIGWLGGTWGATGAPEPTVMALLALGVAGVALRRKKNLTK